MRDPLHAMRHGWLPCVNGEPTVICSRRGGAARGDLAERGDGQPYESEMIDFRTPRAGMARNLNRSPWTR